MSMTPKQVEQASEALRQMKRFEDIIARVTERDVVAITLSGDLTLTPQMGGTGWASNIGYPDDLRKAMTAALVKWAENRYLAARKEALLCGVKLDASKGDPPPVTWPNVEDCVDMSQFVVIDYTNWKGNRRKRPILPKALVFMVNANYHPGKQWLLEAVDLEDNHLEVSETDAKPSTKLFALSGIHGWEPYIGKR